MLPNRISFAAVASPIVVFLRENRSFSDLVAGGSPFAMVGQL